MAPYRNGAAAMSAMTSMPTHLQPWRPISSLAYRDVAMCVYVPAYRGVTLMALNGNVAGVISDISVA